MRLGFNAKTNSSFVLLAHLSPLVLSLLLPLLVILFFTGTSMAQQVSLAWNPNPEPSLAGYKIHYGTSSRNYTHQKDVGNVTQCTISGLEEGKTYYFAATAYDTRGNESGYSNEVHFSIPLSNRAPTAHDASFTVLQDDTLTGILQGSDPDGDPLTFSILSNGTKGKVTLNNSTTGAFSYRPNPGVTGMDSFTFQVSDGKLSSAIATVTVTITPRDQRVTQDLQALYTFQEGIGTTVFDVSQAGTPLDLTVRHPEHVTWLDGGLAVTKPALIASTGAATRINHAVRESGEITLEAWVKPASTNQNGPARIVTLSRDLHNRNFTLGQGIYGGSSSVYDMRLRSSSTDLNGTPSISSPPGSLAVRLTHVVYTRDASGNAKLYVDGEEKASGRVAGDLSNWDAGYQLGLSNELTGDRPWLGEFHLVAIYSRALQGWEVTQNFMAGANPEEKKSPPSIVGQPQNQTVHAGETATFSVAAEGSSPLFYQWQRWNGTIWADMHGETQPSLRIPDTTLEDDNSSYRCRVWNSEGSLTSAAASLQVIQASHERIARGLQALYRFTEGSGNVVRDLSGTGTPLDLTIGNTQRVKWIDGGLAVTGSTLIASPGSATRIIHALQQTGEITVEAWVKPASTNQNGPARIVTLSKDLHQRNFTLGQGIFGGSSAVYDMRLRSTATNLNGTPSLTSPHGSLSTHLTHVVYTRHASGPARIYIDGQLKTSGQVAGNFSNWNGDYRLALANELTGDRPWLGEFHLVAIYNRALEQEEVLQNFWSGSR